MKKRFIMLGICLLTAVLSFCQVNYPSKKVIDGDTIIAISPEQLIKINVTYVEKEKYQVLKDSLTKRYYDIYNLKLEGQELLRNMTAQRDNAIEQNKIFEDNLKQSLVTIDKQNKKIKFLKLTSYVSVGFAGIVTVLYMLK